MINCLALRVGSVTEFGDSLVASLLSDLVKMSGNSKMDLMVLIITLPCKYHKQVAKQT